MPAPLLKFARIHPVTAPLLGKMLPAEYNCLNDLIAGCDAWQQFWRLFGHFILYELKQLDITDQQLREDIYHELVLKIIQQDFRPLRAFIDDPKQNSFAAYLRVIARHLAISYLRKHSRVVLLDPQQLCTDWTSNSDWSGDPALRYSEQQLCESLFEQVCGGGDHSAGFQIMHLRFVQQLSVNAIATRMRMKPNTVSQRIRYYLRRLRNEYALELAELSDE